MMCISQDLGFDSWKPVAAFVIYKCLLHRRSFEVERTSAFDWIIPIVASVIAVHDSIDALTYWLSNISTLLTLLQHTLKASEAVSSTRTRRRSSAASLFGRISQAQSAGLPFSTRRKLGKYPALLFKMELTAFLEKIYRMIRDSLKKEISPVAPGKSRRV